MVRQPTPSPHRLPRCVPLYIICKSPACLLVVILVRPSVSKVGRKVSDVCGHVYDQSPQIIGFYERGIWAASWPPNFSLLVTIFTILFIIVQFDMLFLNSTSPNLLRTAGMDIWSSRIFDAVWTKYSICFILGNRGGLFVHKVNFLENIRSNGEISSIP